MEDVACDVTVQNDAVVANQEDDFLTIEEILGYDDIKMEKVLVPEWGNKAVYVCSMSAKERDKFEEGIITTSEDGKAVRNMDNFRAKLCARCIRNKNRKPMFKTNKEIEQLGEKSASAVDRLFAVAQRINGFAQKDVDELTKNSTTGQKDV